MIAAVTNFYNPASRPNKLDNFHRFRESLKGVELFVVEAAFGDSPFILPSDSHHIQVRCRDILWQQYRLVDLGIRSLPDRFDKAVWIDADILFTEDDWAERMESLLDQFEVVQSYGRIALLDKGGNVMQRKDGVAKEALKNAQKPTATDLAGNLDLSAIFATGFSWGVRRELVERHGIYDRWITGSDDIAFVIGIWGDWDNDFITSRLNDAMRKHYMEWAVPFHHHVGGRVSYLDTEVAHLWHGQRNYRKRWRCLRDYDPATDVAVAGGVLEWRTDKAHLKECCARMCLNYDIEFSPYL